jgi:DNA sulfur modification protein DndE
MIETVHITQKSKDQLIKLKRITGIQNWNILCRWGFCLSLSDRTVPPLLKMPGESAVEMTWKVFGGQFQDIYSSLLIERCKRDCLPIDKESLSQQFRLHVHRGIGQLAERITPKYIDGLYKIIE